MNLHRICETPDDIELAQSYLQHDGETYHTSFNGLNKNNIDMAIFFKTFVNNILKI